MSPKIIDSATQHAREAQILAAALRYIQQESIATFTVDKLVKELPFSKGTVYNHFSGKEDILLALCNSGMTILADLFLRAERFDGIPRERGLAIHFAYMLYARLYPTQFMLVLSAKTSNITDKASERQKQANLILESQLFEPVTSVFQDALAQNLMDLPVSMTIEQLGFACWSLSFGTNALLLEDVERCGKRTGMVVERELLNNVALLFDGMRLRPYSHEFDWSTTLHRLKHETFKEEVTQLEARGVVLAV